MGTFEALGGGTLLFAVGVLAVVGFIFLTIARFFKFIKKVPSNEALIVFGVGCKSRVKFTRRVKQPDGTYKTEEEEVVLPYKIVRGGMVLVFPMIQQAMALDLRVYEEEIRVEKVLSSNAVPLTVDAVVQLSLDEDLASIATAARLHLGKPIEKVLAQANATLQGHLRAMIGLMTVEGVYKDRETFAQKVLEVAFEDMRGLGLRIVSFVIKEITDEVGYLENLGKPEIAVVAKNARIAEAEADQLATQREREAERAKAEYNKTTEVAKAEYQALIAIQQAVAEKAKEIASAQQNQKLEEQKAAAAETAAKRTNMELEASERRPADAARYVVEQEAQAGRFKAEQDAAAARLTGQGEADANKAKGLATAEITKATRLAEAAGTEANLLAEATGIKAKLLAEAEGKTELAKALNTYGPEALRQVLGEKLLGGVPDVARAFASAFERVKEIRLIDFGGGDGADGEGKTTVEKFMDMMPNALFKFLQGATALLATPIDEMVGLAIMEAAKKRGIEVTSEQQKEITEKVVAKIAEEKESIQEPALPESKEPATEAPVSVEPKPKERRRRLTKQQSAEKPKEG